MSSVFKNSFISDSVLNLSKYYFNFSRRSNVAGLLLMRASEIFIY